MAEQIERLTGLVAFVRAASLGSYSAAARSLSISPSAVSKSIQRLERSLGVRLFNRTTRSVLLTDEGRELHERAVRLLRDAEDLERAVEATKIEPAGVLKVTAPLPLGTHVLATALPRFRERYPKLTIDLWLTDRLVDITEESFDVAVRIGHLVDSRLIALHLGAHRVGAFASPEYLAKRGTPLHPDDLDGHDTVNFRYVSNGQVAQWSFQLGDRLVEVDVQSGITADSGDAVAQATAGGGGIGICPTYVAAPYVKRGKLVPVLDAAAVDHLPISALWPESGRGNPNVKAFTSFLSELFSPPAPWDAIVAEASAKPARRDDTASEEPSSGPRISDRTA